MSRVVKASVVLAVVWAITASVLASSPAAAAAAAAPEPIELRIYAWWGQTQHAAIKKTADEWAKDHPGVTVEVLQIPGSTHGLDGLIANTAAGVPMDLVTLQTPFIQYAAQGLLLPLDQLSRNGKWAITRNYPDSILDSFRYNGNVYGFPAAEACVGMLLFYNVGLFEEIGWAANQPPATLEEMVEAHRKLSRRDPATGLLTQIGWNPYDAMPGSYFETIYGAMFNLNWFNAQHQTVNLRAFEPLIHWGEQTYEISGLQPPRLFGGPAGDANLVRRARVACDQPSVPAPGEHRVGAGSTAGDQHVLRGGQGGFDAVADQPHAGAGRDPRHGLLHLDRPDPDARSL